MRQRLFELIRGLNFLLFCLFETFETLVSSSEESDKRGGDSLGLGDSQEFRKGASGNLGGSGILVKLVISFELSTLTSGFVESVFTAF